jgi:hypothetical protein
MVRAANKPKTLGLVTVILPGPARKRTLSLYHFHVTYRHPDPRETGCVMTWDVTGGRMPYQIAAERTETGELDWHCTCADAVYRGDRDPKHCCKHVHGLLQTMPTVLDPVAKRSTAAA